MAYIRHSEGRTASCRVATTTFGVDFVHQVDSLQTEWPDGQFPWRLPLAQLPPSNLTIPLLRCVPVGNAGSVSDMNRTVLS